MSDFALLTPVPLEHLPSALETCLREGKVAFGSRAGLVFAELENRTEGASVDVLIYASGGLSGPPSVTWTARYLRTVGAKNGAHPEGMTFRPASTQQYALDNHGHWLIFWEVAGLRRLEDHQKLPIGKLFGADRASAFKPTFRPEGPIIVRAP